MSSELVELSKHCVSVILKCLKFFIYEDFMHFYFLYSLMTKFSKKLVSKCIYIQILKTTKTDLLGM